MTIGENIIQSFNDDTVIDYFYGVNRVSRNITGDAYTYDVENEYYDSSIDDYVYTTTPVNGYHEFYAYDGRGNVVHTLNLDITDLYIAPHYGLATPFPESDIDNDGTIGLSDINLANNTFPIVQSYYYSPFGEVWQGAKANDTNTFRYAGELFDNETGNIYLRARYYDPSTGRFTSIDPIKDGTNWYVYCGNNPIAFVDPSGMTYDKVIDALSAMYKAKSTMDCYDDANHEDIYSKAYADYNSAKATIADSTIYIESWGQLKPILEPIVSNDVVSLEQISAVKEMVITTQKESERSQFIDEAIYVTGLTLVIAPTLKYGFSKLFTSVGNISPPQKLTFDSVKLGTKYGKHRFDYPGLTHSEYQDLASSIFNNPSQIIYDEACSEFYYIQGENLLRVTFDGCFRSLYPGASSERVLNAIERGISWVLN